MKSIQNTTLSCGLLNTPVKIFAASGTEPEIKFNQCGPQGEALERLDVIAEEPDDRIYTADKDRRMVRVVTSDKIQKSYEGRVIPNSDLEKIQEESLKGEDGSDLKQINIEKFIPLKDVPMERATKLYYIGPNTKFSTKSFQTFIEGLKKKKAAAIAKVVIRSRQVIMALYVKNGILHASVLNFAATMNNREDSELTTDVDVVKAEVAMMGNLIDSLMGEASDIDDIKDTYVEGKRRLIEKVIEGEPITNEIEAPKTKKQKDDSLLKALEESVKVATKKKVKA